MKRCKTVVIISLAALFIALASQCWATTSEWTTRPGTVGNALSSDVQDGASVYLDAVVVDKIHVRQTPKYFTVRECFDPKSKIVVLVIPPEELRYGQTVDVSGIIVRLPDGNRAIGKASVFAYLSEDGDILYHGPLIKGPWNPTPWPYKENLTSSSISLSSLSSVVTLSEDPTPPGEPSTESISGPIYCETIADARTEYSATERILVELQCRPIDSPTSGQFTLEEDGSSDSIPVYYTNANNLSATDRINKVVGTIQKDVSDNYWIEVDSGPNWQSQDVAGSVQSVPQGSIAWIKTLADTTTLPSALSGKIVSRVFAGQGYFYIQEPGRINGIRIIDSVSALTLNPGDTVTIQSGDITTVDGERAINSYYTEFISSGDAPSTVGLANKALGGGNYNIYTSGPVGGFGLNNVGLLVRAWGKVTAVGDGYYYLDDGSALDDGSGNIGVRVEGSIGYMPSVDDYVAVNAISGLTTIEGNYARTLRMAGIADFTPMSPVCPQGISAIATGSDEVTIYWPATPGAAGYNVYMGTDSGQENYSTPINGSTPITQPIYAGSGTYSFTKTGLSDTLYYYFTVKAIVGSTESAPSDEAIASPYSEAIPWDSCDPSAITEAVRSRTGIPYGNYQLKIRVCGPDGRIYSSSESAPLPADGTVIEGTNLLQRPTGDIEPLSGDWMTEESGGMQMASLEPTTLNQSDGPYRRVRSIYDSENIYIGSQGNFYLPNGNAVSLHRSSVNRDTPYVYLGHHLNPATTGVSADVDAGMYYDSTTSYGNWRPYMWGSVNGNRYDAARYFLNLGKGIKYMAGATVFMRYFVDYDQTYLVIDGFDDWFNEVVTILANPYPVVTAIGGQMKRCESIAQGALNGQMIMRRTGSHIWGNSCSSMTLLELYGGYIYTVPWSDLVTQESGSYPAKGILGGNVIDWQETNPYIQEDYIDIDL